ncbi:MAG: ferredoxin family protein [Kiritimatiellae bacterium]|nr:ferredoxin family protein [Kiritimatiellia bacterium]
MIVVCKCASGGVLPAESLRKIIDELSGRGIKHVVVEDLCRMVSVKSPFLGEISEREDVAIAACHPRAVRWLLRQAGARLSIPDARILNIRTDDVGLFIDRLSEQKGVDEHIDSSPDLESGKEGTGWFPVVDHDRCKKCGQCISFCPFGVYTVSDDGRPLVTNPENCKDNCPACARMCPAVAIIFPKVKISPIDGAEVKDEEVERRKAESLSEKLKGGNLHSILAERRRGKKR